MEYTRLGNTGLNVSRICSGCMWFGRPGNGGIDASSVKKTCPLARF
ncbi:MAG: hypothetical protein IKG21_10895 [Atopobiaceae bacterium]|nr:hypothetical protein [Atopobiaceae bacterium]